MQLGWHVGGALRLVLPTTKNAVALPMQGIQHSDIINGPRSLLFSQTHVCTAGCPAGAHCILILLEC
jgi:hypothetical protein